MKNRKFLALVLLVPLFLISFSKPIHAEGLLRYGINAGFKAGTALFSVVTGFDGSDVLKTIDRMGYSIAVSTLTHLDPTMTADEEELKKNPDIPVIMRKGALGMTNDAVIAMFETYPQVDVVAHLSREWVPGYRESESVYASGYDDLQGTGIDTIWSKTRNIAYLGFVVIMIVIGFMIMFRTKIGGQVLVTVGNSIPRIVVALILVTFSFALIGLLIDIGGVLMNVTDYVLGLDSGGLNPLNMLSMLWRTFGGPHSVKEIFTAPGEQATRYLSQVNLQMTARDILRLGLEVGDDIVAPLIMLVWSIIIIGIVIFGAIKLLFTLIKSYLALMVNVIVAPLAIMVGAIPGSQNVTANLFKSALRNAMVFPVAYAIINLPYAIEPHTAYFQFPSTYMRGAGLAHIWNFAGVPLGNFYLAIAKIVAIYVAAKAPVFLKAFIPPTASKSGSDAAAAISESLQKMPLVGGLFKSK
jgi:hypothetical protein